MTDCIFCKIIQKQAPASIVYEDGEVVAFLSNHPVNEGHTLVVPKKHYSNIFDIPEDEAAYLFRIVKRVAHAVRGVTGDAIRLVQNNGLDAGQVVFHMHVHIIPMKPGNHFWREHGSRAEVLLEEDAEKIRKRMR